MRVSLPSASFPFPPPRPICCTFYIPLCIMPAARRDSSATPPSDDATKGGPGIPGKRKYVFCLHFRRHLPSEISPRDGLCHQFPCTLCLLHSACTPHFTHSPRIFSTVHHVNQTLLAINIVLTFSTGVNLKVSSDPPTFRFLARTSEPDIHSVVSVHTY